MSKMGRPSEYDPAFCQRVVELAREGMSLTEIASELDVARSSLYEWEKVHPDFSDALARARQECQAWWERKGRSGLDAPGFNASLWGKNVSCRFPRDWTEKTKAEISGPEGGPLNVVTRIELVPGGDGTA